jgi:manganese/zinc/iron transport system permease protein
MTIDILVTLLTGIFVAASCALLGSFLMLRRMAMLGDAISHAVLPGIVLAFLFTGSRGSFVMFIGAVVMGMLTTFFIQFLSNKGVQGDAAIGVTFTFLFAVGVVLISLYGQSVDLDLDCVLYGELAYTPFDTLMLGGVDIGPRPLWINAIIFALVLIVIIALYKQFKLSSFDPAMAAAIGIPVVAMHYLLMLMVSVTTVGAFESVGAILVVAMLIIPAATAYLLSDKLTNMLWLAVGIGVLSASAGYLLAILIDASIAGSISVVAGAFFVLAFVFSPTHGVLAKSLNQKHLRDRVRREDALLWAWRLREKSKGHRITSGEMSASLGWSPKLAKQWLGKLYRNDQLRREGDDYSLSDKGITDAQYLIDRHRAYEHYLENVGIQDDHTHLAADREEHQLSAESTEQLLSGK